MRRSRGPRRAAFIALFALAASGSAQTPQTSPIPFSTGTALERVFAYGEAREILETLDDRRQEAVTLNNLGVAYNAIGEVERARLYLTQALALRRAVEDRRGEIVTLNNLGWLELMSGSAREAAVLHQQALEVARATSDARNEGISRSHLGEAQAAAGRAAEALAELDKALALQRQTGDRHNEAITLRTFADYRGFFPGFFPAGWARGSVLSKIDPQFG